ncbi:MAG: hypothetical protein J6M18_06900 [Actinomycetaceae bacterium]|nr:hypothetical protein [Actinomycetaceae bacterium]
MIFSVLIFISACVGLCFAVLSFVLDDDFYHELTFFSLGLFLVFWGIYGLIPSSKDEKSFQERIKELR